MADMTFEEFSALAERAAAEHAADVAAGRPLPNDFLVRCPNMPASPELRRWLESLDDPTVRAAAVAEMVADINELIRDDTHTSVS